MTTDNVGTRELADQFYTSFFLLNDCYSRWARKHGLNSTLLFCLYIIVFNPQPPSPGEIAQKLSLSKQTVNSALDLLERRGYLTREEAPNNKRSRLVILTPAGELFAKTLLNDFVQMEDQVFSALPPRDRKSFARIGAKLAARLNEVVDA